MAEVTDIVERVARAIYSERSAAEPGLAAHLWETENTETRDWYFALARAALAAMLEAVGEPVAWRWEHWGHPKDRFQFHTEKPEEEAMDGWTLAEFHSLAALREEL